MSKLSELDSLKIKYTESVIAAQVAGENLLKAAGEGPAAIVAALAAVKEAAEQRDCIEVQLRAIDEDDGQE
ncbi:hypothetical protein [Uliginosibacterium sediminicola]|uniref:Uncharacterized protein n=1 Tax=Uliginosibacterium sediminicola TaxID=2024550 RepID=A0ABU9YVL9_9RHOO